MAMDVGAPPVPVLPSSRLRTRLRMYSMMFSSTLTIKTVRYAIPMIAPYVVSDLNLGDTDLANMLGAFFPGSSMPYKYMRIGSALTVLSGVYLTGCAHDRSQDTSSRKYLVAQSYRSTVGSRSCCWSCWARVCILCCPPPLVLPLEAAVRPSWLPSFAQWGCSRVQ